MNWGHNTSGVKSKQSYPDLEKIFIHARNINLLWRHEILAENNMDSTKLIEEMEDDIFWDLAEIDMEKSITKSLRMTNLGISRLPDKMTIPFNTQILDLSGNHLENIPIPWFDHFQHLHVLRIANNKFQEISWEALSKLENIRIIDLRKNNWKDDFKVKFNSFIRAFRDNIIKIYW